MYGVHGAICKMTEVRGAETREGRETGVCGRETAARVGIMGFEETVDIIHWQRDDDRAASKAVLRRWRAEELTNDAFLGELYDRASWEYVWGVAGRTLSMMGLDKGGGSAYGQEGFLVNWFDQCEDQNERRQGDGDTWGERRPIVGILIRRQIDGPGGMVQQKFFRSKGDQSSKNCTVCVKFPVKGVGKGPVRVPGFQGRERGSPSSRG
ncbi:hypothetical protein EDB92DRAFT_1820031 [Lactarius akahatsu]|uniref:Uncharacterized protein n=1 Tax=Lactarius akahatsu TaxID=416441 RepID=A0AAD4Q8Z1_9AGAM|nr:hypothetical protein EDB92DRAFT_1820031 [Lactarius akahatsu]